MTITIVRPMFDSEIKAIVFDFDGVFTNNSVYTSSNGEEYIQSSKSDSFALSVFRDFIGRKGIELETYVITTEKNISVNKRCEKLELECLKGVNSKKEAWCEMAEKLSINDPSNILYLGNDLNDYEIMMFAKSTACPSDSHKEIKRIADFISQRKGGEGFVRDVLEKLMEFKYTTSLTDYYLTRNSIKKSQKAEK